MTFAISQAAAVPLTPAAQAAAAQRHKLTDAAQQFEGMLLQELLKPMKEHGFCDEDDQDSADTQEGGSGFADTLSSFGTESMATAIAKGGGLGIAKRVVEQVEGERYSRNQTAHESARMNSKINS
jgi:peptidoglycan hydrolase FlgJ